MADTGSGDEFLTRAENAAHAWFDITPESAEQHTAAGGRKRYPISLARLRARQGAASRGAG